MWQLDALDAEFVAPQCPGVPPAGASACGRTAFLNQRWLTRTVIHHRLKSDRSVAALAAGLCSSTANETALLLAPDGVRCSTGVAAKRLRCLAGAARERRQRIESLIAHVRKQRWDSLGSHYDHGSNSST